MAKNEWSLNTFRSINWDVPGNALQTLENSARIFIVKFAHDHLPTRRHMHWIKKASTDKCPACMHITKTAWQRTSLAAPVDHSGVLRCSAPWAILS
jgi:hypothetical protein